MIAVSLSQGGRPVTADLIVQAANRAIEKYLAENKNDLTGAILTMTVVKEQDAPPKAIPQK